MELDAAQACRVSAQRGDDQRSDDDPISLGRETQVGDCMPNPGRCLGWVHPVIGAQDDQGRGSSRCRKRVVGVAQHQLGVVQGPRTDTHAVDARLTQRPTHPIGQGRRSADEDLAFGVWPSSEPLDALGTGVGHGPDSGEHRKKLLHGLRRISMPSGHLVQLRS